MRQADINWLPNRYLKSIPDVRVIYEENTNQEYGGYYTHGSNILTVVEDEYTASTIAHEFRHFLQETKGLLKPNPQQWKQVGTYEDSIHKYFWGDWLEMDALLFQYKYANDEYTDWWLNKLVLRK